MEECGTSSDINSPTKMTPAQIARMDKNRQKALLIKQAREKSKPYSINFANAAEKSIIRVQGSKYIDTGGGFLLEEKDLDEPKEQPKITTQPASIIKSDRPNCLECEQEFPDSFLYQSFQHPVCDNCRDNEEKHSLITRTDAKNEYLLKDCDLDKREPILKFVVRKNPHNTNWGDMKLYLELQVEKRALEIYGDQDKLNKEKERRQEAKEKTKLKKYNKQIKALRMNVRSSLYDRTSKSHEHDFGPESYNEEDDNYTRKCKTCSYEETFEKM